MLGNNIKISQTTNEIILNVNVIAEIDEIIAELEDKLPKLSEFYQNLEIEKVKKLIKSQIDVEVRFDDVSDLLGLHAIKRTFEVETDISETKFIQCSLRSGQKKEYPGSLVICGDVNAGAEVIAGGNIMIMGSLRGLAHAGANRKQNGYHIS